jgi:hypothetical protein
MYHTGGSTAARSCRLVRGGLAVALAIGLVGCPRRQPPPAAPPVSRPAPTGPVPVETAVSDIATGGSWQEGGQSGILRVVVRSGGRRDLRSDVQLEWLRWDDRAAQPIQVKSVKIVELSRGGIIVTATRIEQEEGRPVVRLDVANAVTGVSGEARIWPQAVGRYRAKLKWVNGATAQ